jgi:hypothetical protein
MLVPWEAIHTAMSKIRKIILDPADILTEFTALDDIEELTAGYTWTPDGSAPAFTIHPRTSDHNPYGHSFDLHVHQTVPRAQIMYTPMFEITSAKPGMNIPPPRCYLMNSQHVHSPATSTTGQKPQMHVTNQIYKPYIPPSSRQNTWVSLRLSSRSSALRNLAWGTRS